MMIEHCLIVVSGDTVISGEDIKSFTVADAQGKDDKQISDINAFIDSGNCDLLIVSPTTTAACSPSAR